MPKRSKLVATDPTKNVLEWEETKRLEAAARCERDRMLVRVLRLSACRISEALALKVQDVAFHQGGIIIAHLKERVSLRCMSCNGRLSRQSKFCPACAQAVTEVQRQVQQQHTRRLVPLDKESLDTLKQYISDDDPAAPLFGISYRRAYQIIKECAEAAGLPNLVLNSGRVHHISPHRLRDALATHAASVDDSNDGLRMLQEQLGHASIATTMKYRKVKGEELKSWHERVIAKKEDSDALAPT